MTKETLSDKIKYLHKEKYLQIGSSIDVWAKSKRIDFVEAEDVKKTAEKIKDIILDRYPKDHVTIAKINKELGKKLI